VQTSGASVATLLFPDHFASTPDYNVPSEEATHMESSKDKNRLIRA
jgi:hypothetical protein